MYTIMGIAEQGGINYSIENNDYYEELEADSDDEIEDNLKQFNNVFAQIKNGSPVKSVDKSKMKSGVLPRNLLDKIEEAGPQIRSLLSRV